MREKLFSIGKKDLKIEYFSGTGAGGQHRNKHQNCVRIHHKESGALVTGQSHRERKSNTREALKNLIVNPKFKMWYNQKIQEVLLNKSIEQVVDEMMSPEHLAIEVKKEGKWTQIEKDSIIK
jgi:protein subunit release factor A